MNINEIFDHLADVVFKIVCCELVVIGHALVFFALYKIFTECV